MVRWRIRNFAAGSSGPGLGFVTPRVVRPDGAGRFQPVATGATRLIPEPDGAIHEFATSLPVAAGDHIAIETENVTHPLRSLRGPVQSLLRAGIPDGGTPEAPYWERITNSALLVAADVEVPEAGGSQPPPEPPPPPLTFNFLRLDPVRFVATARPAAPARARTPLPEGSTVNYRLSRPALVRLQILRLTRGFRQGERCTRRSSALTRELRREIARELPRGLSRAERRAEIRRRLAALKCAIDTPVPGGTLLREGGAGPGGFPFDGWAGGAPLPAGLYTLRGGAAAADGVVSNLTSRRFRVLPAGVRLPRDLLTMSRRGFVRQPVYCRTGNRGGCRGVLELRAPLTRDGRATAASRVLGRARFRIARRSARTVRVRLPRSARRLVRRHGRVRITVRVHSRDDTGPAPVLERRMPLRESRRRR